MAIRRTSIATVTHPASPGAWPRRPGFLAGVLTLLLFSGCGEPPTTEAPPVIADPHFEAVQPDLLGAPGSLTNAWADIDRDGDPDLFVGFNGTPNRLYRNDGGVLVDVAMQLGLADERSTRTAAWGDFDADGDPDLLLGFVPGEGSVTRLYRNEGAAFVDVTAESGLEVQEGSTRQASWVDFDADGDLDLFLALRDLPNALFVNQGGRFRDAADSLGLADPRRTVGGVWFDYQEDGDLDLLVTNMNGDANGLFRNDGGLFTDVAGEVGLAEGGRGLGDESLGTVRPCVADFDNDGSLDLFFANYGPNGLFKEDVSGSWHNVGTELGIAIDARYDACAFGDFDHDGRIDLFVNGTVTGGVQYRDYLFRNTPEAFLDLTPEELLALDADHGVQWVDFDLDGDLDLSLAGATDTGMHHVMRNLMEESGRDRSIQVRVVDSRGRETRAGAEIRIYEAGTRTLLGTRTLDTGSGYDSQSHLPAHFGLPHDGPIDIEVLFPGSGHRGVTVLEDVNPRYHVGRPVTVTLPG